MPSSRLTDGAVQVSKPFKGDERTCACRFAARVLDGDAAALRAVPALVTRDPPVGTLSPAVGEPAPDGWPGSFRMLRMMVSTWPGSRPYVPITDTSEWDTAAWNSCCWLYWSSVLSVAGTEATRRPAKLAGSDAPRPPCATAARWYCAGGAPGTPAAVMVMVWARPIRFGGQFWLAPGLPR